ncbi:MAG: ATPase, T2SS/T4P/T4SS family [Candidatus Omnitrophica bacterium]|nr:ATPase, T2SS/T4P/T4SS family [Candidatus Omnitrophota bacterium]
MNKTDNIFCQALIKKGILSADALDPLIREAESSFQPLNTVILKHKLVNEKTMLEILSEEFKIPVVDIKSLAPEKALINRIPPKIVYYYKFLPLKIFEHSLTVAVSYPLDIKTQDEIRTQLGLDLEIVLAFSYDIREALGKYYNVTTATMEKIASSMPQQAPVTQPGGAEKVEDIEKLAGDASIIKLVNQIILEAWRKRSTDIHIEPYRAGVSLRYRVDGILYEENVPAEIKNFINAIISRIKIMSNLNIVERRLPQDGRAVVKVAEQVLDLRISTIPTPFGESVVIRILPTQMLFNLEKLGLAKKDQVLFESFIEKPHGIIFVTGPTGSGKTTTLYTCLSKINTRDRKIITIEDPIEYEMSGITQIQVMPEVGLDFARGLRSILRHDPDVIMVGEVRDLETAEIAIRVALTGHLVFSTLHTNDAASGITRLIDIGVEPYLVASSVEAFIAQRLVRVICSDCKYEDKAAPVELKRLIARDLGLAIADVNIYRGKGCSSCNFTGFFGRTAIYEIITIDDVIKDLIIKKAPSGAIKKAAVSRGMRTLAQDGWYKVINGVTTPEEVMRVTTAEDNKTLGEPVSSDQNALSQTSLENDRRTFIRLSSNINLRYKIFRSEEELFSRGVRPEEFSITRNISAGGLLFISHELLVFGSVLELNIDLPVNQETVQCLARVVRVSDADNKGIFEIGVCFLDLTGAQRAKLEQYVEKRVVTD